MPCFGSTNIISTDCASTGGASMLYLDYARKPGEWVPNRFGGRENLDAVHFCETLNEQVYAIIPT